MFEFEVVNYSSSSSRSSTGACLRKRDEKRPWRGAGAGGGKDVGRDEVAPAVGVRGSALSLSSGLSQELNPGQTVPNGRCYHYTTKPSRVKDAGARLVG